MNLNRLLSLAKARALALSGRRSFDCPVCNWHGPFLDHDVPTGYRYDARCPNCDALERHRLQRLVMDRVLPALPMREMKMLHFAPEAFLRSLFADHFGGYETADIEQRGVDHLVDIQALPFEDGSFDFVYASHVLEHIPDDRLALSEIRRVLRPGGVAVLPVPIVAKETIEYAEPNPMESMHVRAPGPDYFDRYRDVFARVELFDSNQVPAAAQPFACVKTTAGTEKVVDFVPVCYV